MTLSEPDQGRVMELWALRSICKGVDSLAQLEKSHPVLGNSLANFVETVNQCCRQAYERFSDYLGDVLALPLTPTDAERDRVLKRLEEASSSTWFRDVAGICDKLAVLADQHDDQITAQIEFAAKPGNPGAGDARHSLQLLLMILHKHEGDLKDDMRGAVQRLTTMITDGKIEDARAYAVDLSREIDGNLTRINVIAGRITASGSRGAEEFLTNAAASVNVAAQPSSRPQRTVVILIHGIRTAAWWQSRVASIFSDELGATVIPLKYGYFDLFRFLCPLGFCRRGPIERLRKQLQGIRDNFGDARLVVFAHSYGSYALSRVLVENPRFTFDRVILCGSIVPEDFDWDRVQDQILTKDTDKRDAIINECGTHDVWPVFASSVSWGYGASGTYGFGVQNVRDRYHPSGHSAYFVSEFVRKYWVPAVAGLPIDFSPTDRDENTASPAWFGLLRLPLRLVLFGVLPALILYGAYAGVAASRNGWCWQGTLRAENACVSTTELSSRKEIRERISLLLRDTNAVLDLKGGVLFDAMDRYQQTPEDWNNILSTVKKLQDKIGTSLDEIVNYNSYLSSSGDKYILLTKDGKVSIDAKYWHAFESVRQQMKGRSTIFTRMAAATSPPDRAQVQQWGDDLRVLHSELQAAVQPIQQLL